MIDGIDLIFWACAWLYFVVWFFAVAKYLDMREDGTYDEVPKFFRWCLFLGLVPGLILDVIFNATYGTVHFRELPREWTFSRRVKRHYKGITYSEGVTRRETLAIWWADVLNTIDPGHV